MLLSDGRTLEYKYDAEERITKVIDSADGTTEYTYDALGQLLTERLNGHIINSMTYDTYGNIISKNGQTYFYDSTWHDLLTGIESESIEYDAQGNPTKYLGHTLVWEKGRQLKSYDSNTYTYNANGIRTSKTVNGVKHEYTLDGTKILRETWGSNTLVPLYDNEDSVCGIIYNSVPYYFLKNLQGDVIAIVDKDAETVARYSYDAWGKLLSITDEDGADLSNNASHIAIINPFRYRGYYYDQGTGLYYLNSRYYDPSVGRFINGDEAYILLLDNKFSTIDNINLYVYCDNNSIMFIDPDGYDAIYVVDYDSVTGIPVIGHSVLCFQDKTGTWYYTEYSGQNKSSAKVSCSKLQGNSYNRLFGNITTSIIATSGTKFVYIKGDFKNCLKKAQSYVKNGFGKYNLITNNCLNYVQKVLGAGKCPLRLKILCNMPFIAPNAFGNALALYVSSNKLRIEILKKVLKRNLKILYNTRF